MGRGFAMWPAGGDRRGRAGAWGRRFRCAGARVAVYSAIWAAALVEQGARALDNGLGQTPPMGWNSWGLKHNISEEIIAAQADALVASGLRDVGYRYLNLDGGWQDPQRDASGNLRGSKDLFPSGMGRLGEYVHSNGLLYGIYSSAGFTACNGFPGSFGYEEADAQRFADWGVDYLKYDNCADGAVDPYTRYERMSQALNRTGRPIFFNICEWGIQQPWRWAHKIANSWRTTPDIVNSFLHGYGSCHSIQNIIMQNEVTHPYAGPNRGFNDPDLLQVGLDGVSDVEGKSQFSIWAIMKAPLLINADLRNMSEATLTTLRNEEVIAVNQDPLGMQGRRIRQTVDIASGALDVWAGPLEGGDIAVVLFNQANLGSGEQTITLHWEDIGLDPRDEAAVRDLWAHTTLGTFSGDFSASVAPHDCVVLRVTPLGRPSSRDWAAPTRAPVDFI